MQSSYTVGEAVGSVVVCAMLSEPIERNVNATLSTVESGSAQGMS